MARISTTRRLRSIRHVQGIAIVVLVAACGQAGQATLSVTSPSVEPSPTTSGTTPRPGAATPGAAGHARLETEVLGKPGEAILLQTSADATAPLRFLVAGVGGEREVAQVTNLVAGVEGGWIRSAVANEAGLAAIVTEVPDDQRRLLVYDLNAPTTLIYETVGDPWHSLGRRGFIAIGSTGDGTDGRNEVVVHDLGSSPSTPGVYRLPEGIRSMGLSATATGLVAARQSGEGAIEIGKVGLDGAFVSGPADQLFVTGLERIVGPGGETLAFAHGDGQGWSSMSIIARGASTDVAWYESRSDRSDPEPNGVAWDPAGRGLWIALTTPTEIRVALFREPTRPTVIAVLPRTPGDAEVGPPTIVGIHPSGGTIALGRRGNGEGAEVGPGAHTILIDVATGSTTEHDAGFVGWAAWGSAP